MNFPLHTNQETFGERVKRLRIERDMSQEKLADFCGVTNGWISKLEKDKYSPSPDLITKIAAAFKLPVHELLQEEDKRMELVSRIKLIEVLLETDQPVEAESYIYELENHPEMTEKDRITLGVHLAESRYQQKSYLQALEILQPLIHRLETSNYHDAHSLAWIRNIMGNIHFVQRDFTTAHYNYQKAYDYTLRFDAFDSLAGKVSLNLSVALRNIGKVGASVFYLEKSYDYFKNINDLKQLSKIYYQQGILYTHKKDYHRAAESFENAKTIMLALNLKSFAIIVEHSLASNITARKDPVMALEQLENCLQYLQDEKDYARMAMIFAKKATIYMQISDLDSAFSQLTKSMNLLETYKLQHTPEGAECFKVYSRYHLSSNNHDMAFEFASKSSELFGKMGLIFDQIELLSIMSDAYEQKGDYPKALEYERKRSLLYAKLIKGED